MGPSVVTLTLGQRRSYLPPWYVPAGWLHPDEWVVTVMIWVAIVIGAVGLIVCMRALADGWRPRRRRLFGLGVVLNCSPPLCRH